MDAVEDFFERLERLTHLAYGDYLDLQKAFSAFAADKGEIDPRELEHTAGLLATQLTAHSAEQALELARAATAMNIADQLRLVAGSRDFYNRYAAGDMEALDEFAARTEAFRYILFPAPEVIAAHEYHRSQVGRIAGA